MKERSPYPAAATSLNSIPIEIRFSSNATCLSERQSIESLLVLRIGKGRIQVRQALEYRSIGPMCQKKKKPWKRRCSFSIRTSAAIGGWPESRLIGRDLQEEECTIVWVGVCVSLPMSSYFQSPIPRCLFSALRQK